MPRPSRCLIGLLLATTAAGAAEPVEERVGRLEAELEALRRELDDARGVQARQADDEAARVARVQAIDDLLTRAAEADAALMAGSRPDLGGMAGEVAALRDDAGRRSGRLEYDQLAAAAVDLDAVGRALDDGDWLVARQRLAGAALELASARGTAASHADRSGR